MKSLLEKDGDRRVEIRQKTSPWLVLINPGFKKDGIRIWTELETNDPQIVIIERAKIKKVIEVLEEFLNE